MCFPDPEDMKVKIILRAASTGVNTVFIGYDSAHARPFLKLIELLAAEKHVSCNIQYIIIYIMCGLKLCWVLIGSFTCYFTWHFVHSDGEHRFWCLKVALHIVAVEGCLN